MTSFCHIVPTGHLDLVLNRPIHLTLAHLIEEDQAYRTSYLKMKSFSKATLIMDNSAFEMFKRKEPMYPTEKLIDVANLINADYVIMSDYPGEPGLKTIEAAEKMIPELKRGGYGTFFCPQSKAGDVEDLIAGYEWAFNNPDIDYIAFSILNIPIALGCETGNPLQKYLSRYHFMRMLSERYDLVEIKKTKKFHFLGMTEGPNEILLMKDWIRLIDTWDSSAAVWAGLNGISFDTSPTGLIEGKFEKEVDFNYQTSDDIKIELAKSNMNYIDKLLDVSYWKN